ncbi:MAG: hypothetical protein AB8G15_13545 [Saprospiraceae bacterium]
MAQSKRKRKIAAKDARDAKKFWNVVIISTMVIMLLMYFLFRSLQ